jgi:hypothetical protein
MDDPSMLSTKGVPGPVRLLRARVWRLVFISGWAELGVRASRSANSATTESGRDGREGLAGNGGSEASAQTSG